jgi:hypothetical protein
MPGKTPTCPHCGESLADSVAQWIENAKSFAGKPKGAAAPAPDRPVPAAADATAVRSPIRRAMGGN